MFPPPHRRGGSRRVSDGGETFEQGRSPPLWGRCRQAEGGVPGSAEQVIAPRQHHSFVS